MSNSIINYENKYINPNDNILIMSLCMLKEYTRVTNYFMPTWLKQYFIDVIDVIIDVKPIGWSDLELDTYFNTDERKKNFIEILKLCIIYLNQKDTKFIGHKEVNHLFKLEGIEKWGEKNYILITEITGFLNDLVLLLDNDISSYNS
jgi:hypothetical protein